MSLPSYFVTVPPSGGTGTQRRARKLIEKNNLAGSGIANSNIWFIATKNATSSSNKMLVWNRVTTQYYTVERTPCEGFSVLCWDYYSQTVDMAQPDQLTDASTQAIDQEVEEESATGFGTVQIIGGIILLAILILSIFKAFEK